MGATITPKYALEMPGTTAMAWQGRIPSVAQLEKFVMEYVVSTYPGMVNEAIGNTFGLTIPSFARVKQNKRFGLVVAEWKAPMFMTLPEAKDYPKVARAVKA